MSLVGYSSLLTMKKILLASPVRGGLSTDYVRTLIALLNCSLCRGPNAKYSIEFAWTKGTSVAMARDEYTDLFLKRGDDELIQWDIDLGAADVGHMLSMFERLLSHDVDIVAGPYVGHNFNSQWHGAAASTTESIRPDGLISMAQIPIGFSKIKRRVFEKIKVDAPWLQCVFKDTQMTKAKTGLFEFYPNGIVGPTTGQGKVERIKELMKLASLPPTDERMIHEGLFRQGVFDIVNDSDYSQNIMLGEDYYFCKLARDSGFELFIDNNLIVPHESGVRLPVNNQKILAELSQDWRLHNSATPEARNALLEQLRTLLNTDIP